MDEPGLHESQQNCFSVVYWMASLRRIRLFQMSLLATTLPQPMVANAMARIKIHTTSAKNLMMNQTPAYPSLI
jgi:hypothetical protein